MRTYHLDGKRFRVGVPQARTGRPMAIEWWTGPANGWQRVANLSRREQLRNLWLDERDAMALEDDGTESTEPAMRPEDFEPTTNPGQRLQALRERMKEQAR